MQGTGVPVAALPGNSGDRRGAGGPPAAGASATVVAAATAVNLARRVPDGRAPRATAVAVGTAAATSAR